MSSKKKVVIVNLETGNLDSVARAVQKCGACPVVTNKSSDLEDAGSVILPGVGSFAGGMQKIEKLGLYDALQEEVIKKKTPILGICLGMQLFATKGYEDGETSGLNWIEGEVKRLEPAGQDRNIPHIGWNEVVFAKDDGIFKNIPSGKDFYFVHSYHFVCKDENDIIAWTPYCGRFTSGIRRDNITGVQFHPEKSQDCGLQIIRNFLYI